MLFINTISNISTCRFCDFYVNLSMSGAWLRLDHHADILLMPGDQHDHVISGTGPDGIVSHVGDLMRILSLSM
jgi:hypothetical protein